MNDARAILKEVLTFVDGHVKFAETKNAAILAANAALLISIGQLLFAEPEKPPSGNLAAYLIVGSICCGFAVVATLLSFLPWTRIPWLHKQATDEKKDNLYFFGDIQKYGVDGYVRAIRAAEGLTASPYSTLERMLGEQVVINAAIASRKFWYATRAMWLTLFAVLTPIGGTVLWIVLKDREPA